MSFKSLTSLISLRSFVCLMSFRLGLQIKPRFLGPAFVVDERTSKKYTGGK